MKDNRGLSLVELLLAFAIGAIVLTGITYLLFTSLRMSGRTNANVVVQSEAQTALNLVVDHIMEAQGICFEVPAADEETECLLIGDLQLVESGGIVNAYFSGNAIVSDMAAGELYLVAIPSGLSYAEAPLSDGMPGYAKLVSSAPDKESAAEAALAEVKGFITPLSAEERTIWLMGKYVSGCRITPSRPLEDLLYEEIDYVNGEKEKVYSFREPFTLHITLSFTYDYGNGIINMTIEDDAAIRSRIPFVYINQKDTAPHDKMHEYRRWR